jgi:hypothetical protein
MASASLNISVLTDWKKDLNEPPKKYNFLLNGKPYRGAFNKKYVGGKVLYYTGVKPNRYSQQLEYKPNGFIIEDEPVKTMLEKWVEKERKADPFLRKIPIYDNDAGANNVYDDDIVRRGRIIGYRLEKIDPMTGEKNILASYYDNKLQTLIVPTQNRNIKILEENLNMPVKQETPENPPYENLPSPPSPPLEPPYGQMRLPRGMPANLAYLQARLNPSPQRPPRPTKTSLDLQFIDDNLELINRFVQLQYEEKGFIKPNIFAEMIRKNYGITRASVDKAIENKKLNVKATRQEFFDEIYRR